MVGHADECHHRIDEKDERMAAHGNLLDGRRLGDSININASPKVVAKHNEHMFREGNWSGWFAQTQIICNSPYKALLHFYLH
jgi:hypothetical protein